MIRYEVFSKDKTVSALLVVRVVTSSCHVGDDSCCGDNYRGVLTVMKGRAKDSFRVAYYRGG